MDKPRYPDISDATLIPFRAIEVQLGTFPDLLDRPECPYPNHVKSLVKRLVSNQSGPVERREYTEDDLEHEIHDLYSELQRTSVGNDAKDQIQLLKTRADLLTRMVALKERFLNAREISRFQRTVLECLDGQLTPTQRNDFLEKLSSHVR